MVLSGYVLKVELTEFVRWTQKRTVKNHFKDFGKNKDFGISTY